jgi:hypothetical protein
MAIVPLEANPKFNFYFHVVCNASVADVQDRKVRELLRHFPDPLAHAL